MRILWKNGVYILYILGLWCATFVTCTNFMARHTILKSNRTYSVYVFPVLYDLPRQTVNYN